MLELDDDKKESISIWVHKRARSGYVGFFYNWIAINIIYNDLYFQRNPNVDKWRAREGDKFSNLINELKEKIDLNKFFKEIKIEDVINLFEEFTLKKRGRDIIPKLREHYYQDEDLGKTFEVLLECLYGIRNNLFHGVKGPDKKNQNKLLKTAYKIVKKLVKLSLKNIYTNYLG